ncbi:serine O-acetyltransferase [Candidatus Omnitrophota bacterium]
MSTNLTQPDMKFICKTAREAFYFDKEELSSKCLIKLLRMYFSNVRYNALVNFRLRQYFSYKRKEIVAGYANKAGTKRHILLSMYLLHPLLSLRYYFYAFINKYVRNSNYKQYGLDISPLADIDRKFWGIFRNVAITAYTKIGKNVCIDANVTIAPSTEGSPVIGDNVCIHTGAVIVGHIQIGDNAIIGANSLVTRSVPPNTTVVGVPSKVVFSRKVCKDD